MPDTFGALASLAVGPAIPIKLISLETGVGIKVGEFAENWQFCVCSRHHTAI